MCKMHLNIYWTKGFRCKHFGRITFYHCILLQIHEQHNFKQTLAAREKTTHAWNQRKTLLTIKFDWLSNWAAIHRNPVGIIGFLLQIAMLLMAHVCVCVYVFFLSLVDRPMHRMPQSNFNYVSSIGLHKCQRVTTANLTITITKCKSCE